MPRRGRTMLRRQGGGPVWLLCGVSKLLRKPSQKLRPFFNDTAVYFQQTGLGHGLAGAVCNQAQARTCPTWIWDGDGPLHCRGLSAAESFARVSLVRCREHLYDIAFQGLQAARLRPHIDATGAKTDRGLKGLIGKSARGKHLQTTWTIPMLGTEICGCRLVPPWRRVCLISRLPTADLRKIQEMPKFAVADSCGFEGSAPDTIRARFSARGRREARVAQAHRQCAQMAQDSLKPEDVGIP